MSASHEHNADRLVLYAALGRDLPEDDDQDLDAAIMLLRQYGLAEQDAA